MNDYVGRQLGNYRLLRLIGQGGFADVYLAEHIHLDTQAAIKVLQMRLVGSSMEEFRNEARTIASLLHPNIVRVLDFGVADNLPYLVMEYAPNGTLRQRHPKGVPLPPTLILPYVKQVAAALQYAHDKNLIHRDIKPENMLLKSNNDVLLSDFGLVQVAHSSSSHIIQEMVGTAPYMAPEQLQGKPRLASDQYALGIVMYEWLSGECPFSGSFIEIASQHVLVPPPPLHDKIPGISPVVENVVLTALAKDPKQRFMTIQAFADAFEQACQTATPYPIASSFAALPLNESAISTYVVPTSVRPLLDQASQPTNVVTPKQPAEHTSVNIPPDQSMFINTSQNQTQLQPFAVSSASESAHFPEVDSMPTRGLQSPIAVPPIEVRQPLKRQLLKRRVSRLAILGCLLGLVVMGASVWLVFSQGLTAIPRPSSTATVAPQAGIGSSPCSTTLRTTAFNLAIPLTTPPPTSTITPTPTFTPTFTPTPTPTHTPTPTPTPTHTPTPVRTYQPTPTTTTRHTPVPTAKPIPVSTPTSC